MANNFNLKFLNLNIFENKGNKVIKVESHWIKLIWINFKPNYQTIIVKMKINKNLLIIDEI